MEQPHVPRKLCSVADYEARCREVIAAEEFEILYGHFGHPDWSTYTSNRAAFHTVKLRPRVLAGIDRRNLSVPLLGHTVALPVVVGPTGDVGAIHPDGELVTARAASAADVLFVLSAVASRSVDDIAPEIDGPWWKQVFIFRDRGITAFLVERAEAYGCGAIVLTVSNVAAPMHHQRVPPGSTYDFAAGERAQLQGYSGRHPESLSAEIDPAVSWSDVDWLRSVASKPVVVKGVQTAEDACRCTEHGVDAIVVSNHGGRYLQGARGTLEALPEIVDAVGDTMEIYLDGGVRQGQDVLKALALGARAVWVGRAVRWGLTVDGEGGVRHVLEILRQELEGSMALCGVGDVQSVERSLVSTMSVATPEN